ncbi:MAG: deoxyhypusine synthase [bacterium]
MKKPRVDYFRSPVEGIVPGEAKSIYGLVESFSRLSFQGRNLGEAAAIWRKMLEAEATIFLGLAGALVPAGFRTMVRYLIENRLIDCLVSTGANIFHDVHETLGGRHWKGSVRADDAKLFEAGVDRIYDTFASEREFRRTEKRIAAVARGLKATHPYTTREFLEFLGKELKKEARAPGIVTTAAEHGTPVFCPAVADSSIGMALDICRYKWGKRFIIDVIGDVTETGAIMRNSGQTGVIYLGGGTPKNFIQQASLVPSKRMNVFFSHDYAIQVTADMPQWGGLSGCTFEEAKSWGKIGVDARQVTVNCDATIAFPLLVSAIAEELPNIKTGKRPRFEWTGDRKRPVRIKYVPRRS